MKFLSCLEFSYWAILGVKGLNVRVSVIRSCTHSEGQSRSEHFSFVGGLFPQALSVAGLWSSDLIHLMDRVRTPIIENKKSLWTGLIRLHKVLGRGEHRKRQEADCGMHEWVHTLTTSSRTTWPGIDLPLVFTLGWSLSSLNWPHIVIFQSWIRSSLINVLGVKQN